MTTEPKKSPVDYMLFVNREMSQVHIFVSTENIPSDESLPAHFKRHENKVTIELDELRNIIMERPELTWIIENQATEQNYLWLLFFMKNKKIEHVAKIDVQPHNNP